MDTAQKSSLAVVGCLLLIGCESLSSKDYIVMHEAFKNETAQAQLTAANLHRQVKALQEQLGAARSAQARFQGELRDAERRLSEGESSGNVKQQEFVKTNAERELLAQAGYPPKAQLSETHPLSRRMLDTGREEKRIKVLQLSIKKLTREVASLNTIVRGLNMAAVPSSSITPDRQSHRFRRGRLSSVPAMPTPQAAVAPMLREQAALISPLPASPPLPVKGVPKPPSAVTPTPATLAAPMSPVPETHTFPNPPAPAPSALASLLPPAPGDVPSVALKTVLMSIRPSDGIALRGLETRVDILAANAVGLTESTFTLRYDPKVLGFRQALEGEFLNGEGPSTMVVDSNPVAGTVTLKVKRAGGSKGVSGDGVLATIAFAGKTVGVSPLVIQSAKLLNESKAVLPVSGWQAVMRVE